MIVQLPVASGLINAVFEVAVLLLWAPLWHAATTYTQDRLLKHAVKQGAEINIDRSSEGIFAWRKVITAHPRRVKLLIVLFAVFATSIPIISIFFAELAINGTSRPVLEDAQVFLVNGNRLRDPDELFAGLAELSEQAAAELTEIETVGTVLGRCSRPQSKTEGTVYIAAFPDRQRRFEYDSFSGEEISGNLCVDGSEVTARMGYSVNSTKFDARSSEITKGIHGARASQTQLRVSGRRYSGKWTRNGVCEISSVDGRRVSAITAPRKLGSRRAFSAFDSRNEPIDMKDESCFQSMTLMIGHLSYYTKEQERNYVWAVDLDEVFEDDRCRKLNVTAWDPDSVVITFEAFGGYCLSAKSLLLNALERLDNDLGAYGREDFLEAMLSFPHLGLKEVDEFADQTLVSWDPLSTQKVVGTETITEVDILRIWWTVLFPLTLAIVYVAVLRITDKDPSVRFSNPVFLLHCLTSHYTGQGSCWPKGNEKMQRVALSISDEGDYYHLGPGRQAPTRVKDERPIC